MAITENLLCVVNIQCKTCEAPALLILSNEKLHYQTKHVAITIQMYFKLSRTLCCIKNSMVKVNYSILKYNQKVEVLLQHKHILFFSSLLLDD